MLSFFMLTTVLGLLAAGPVYEEFKWLELKDYTVGKLLFLTIYCILCPIILVFLLICALFYCIFQLIALLYKLPSSQKILSYKPFKKS